MNEITPENLRKVRERIGWTQRQMAKITGVSYSTFCRYEKGTNRMPMSYKFMIGIKYGEK